MEEIVKLNTEIKGKVAIIHPRGKILGGPDAAVLHDKIHDLLDDNKKEFVLNMEKLEWINATGMGILISALTTVRNKGGELVLCNIPTCLDNLLTLTHLNTAFSTYKSKKEAIQSFQE